MKSPTPSRRSGFSNSCRSERRVLPPPGTPFSPALEAVMPMLVRVYVIRYAALIAWRMGEEAAAREQLADLIPAARRGVIPGEAP